MKIKSMAETALRSSLRTPSLHHQPNQSGALAAAASQHQQHGANNSTLSPLLLSPTPSANSSSSANTSNTNTTTTSGQLAHPQTANQSRILVLRQRKTELDQLLGDKQSLLQQLSRQEAQIIGILPNVGTTDILPSSAAAAAAWTNPSDAPIIDGGMTSLRRKVGTGFRLPDSLLANVEDDLQQLLLGKQVQQQISEASLKLANDPNQTKSIRRAHKQNYENAQTQLQSINHALSSALKMQQPSDHHLQNRASSVSNGNLTHVLMSTNDAHLQQQQQRRNSMVSTNSAHQYLQANNSASAQVTKPANVSQRVRHDSYNNNHMPPPASNHHTTGPVSPALSTNTVYNTHYHYTSHHGAPSVQQPSPGYDYAVRHGNLRASPPPPPLHERSSMKASPRANHRPMMIQSRENESAYLMHQHATTDHHFHLDSSGGGQQHHQQYAADGVSMGRLGSSREKSGGRGSGNNNGGSPGPDQQMLVMNATGGLGGYWATMEATGERVWCSVDNRYSSMDRHQPAPTSSSSHNQSTKPRRGLHQQQLPAVKATSLGNFEFITQQHANAGSISNASRRVTPSASDLDDDDRCSLDATSTTSAGSTGDTTHQKQFKEKQWLETALDAAPRTIVKTVQQRSVSPIAAQPNAYPQKKKLSSHSMHSPGRNHIHPAMHHHGSMMGMHIDKQPYPLPETPSAIGLLHISVAPPAVMNSSAHPTHSHNSNSPSDFYHYHNGHQNQVVSVQHQQQLSPAAASIDHHPMNSPTKAAPFNLRRTLSSVSSGHVTNNTANNNNHAHHSPPIHLYQLQSQQSHHHPQHHSMNHNNNPPNATHHTHPSHQNHNNNPVPQESFTPVPHVAAKQISIESPKNMTVVQPAIFQPYKEVSKPFEMSDFYKYSTKFRATNQTKPDVSQASTTSSLTAHQMHQLQIHQQQQQKLQQQHSSASGSDYHEQLSPSSSHSVTVTPSY